MYIWEAYSAKVHAVTGFSRFTTTATPSKMTASIVGISVVRHGCTTGADSVVDSEVGTSFSRQPTISDLVPHLNLPILESDGGYMPAFVIINSVG